MAKEPLDELSQILYAPIGFTRAKTMRESEPYSLDRNSLVNRGYKGDCPAIKKQYCRSLWHLKEYNYIQARNKLTVLRAYASIGQVLSTPCDNFFSDRSIPSSNFSFLFRVAIRRKIERQKRVAFVCDRKVSRDYCIVDPKYLLTQKRDTYTFSEILVNGLSVLYVDFLTILSKKLRYKFDFDAKTYKRIVQIAGHALCRCVLTEPKNDPIAQYRNAPKA